MIFFGYVNFGIGKVTIRVTDLNTFFHADEDDDVPVSDETGNKHIVSKRNVTLEDVQR